MKMIDETLTYRGQLYARVPDSYATEICDICGNRRKCDYWMSYGRNVRFWDICRSCQTMIRKGKE